MKLSETSLPPKEAFYSRLNEQGITDEDYEKAKTVWKKINIESLEDYTELYNKADVLQLADLFENFRDVCLSNYKLNPVCYYSASDPAWDAALKKTEVKLETKASSHEGQCIPAGSSVSPPRRVLISLSIITMSNISRKLCV